MIVFKSATVLSLVALSTPKAPDCTLEEISSSTELLWCPCETDFFCAKLDVPLDYQNPHLGRASVPLIKRAAKPNSPDGAYQGQILVNPGGPGGSGVEFARANGSLMQSLVGTNWDIVGFDPRGVGLSEPMTQCSVGTASSQHELRHRSTPRVADEFYQSYLDYAKELGDSCAKTSGGERDAGPHMSTTVTARDMASIVDAFAESEDGKRASKKSHLLNYYGISYGTMLGQTFVSLFPDKVGNVIFDGIVGPKAYLESETASAINHLDGVIAAFFVYCHEAGEALCPYYTGSTPRDIFERFNHSFVQLDPREAKAHNWSNATDIEAALFLLKVDMLGVAYSPLETFGTFATTLLSLEAAIAAQDVKSWTDQLTSVIGDPTPVGVKNPTWSIGVLCSDQNGNLYNKTLEELKPLIKRLEEQSIVGEVWIKLPLGCAGWPIRSKDIFTGPFGGNTATPILFVSNTYDPVTPIENSLSDAPKYTNAQVLTIDGMGHTSISTNNQCALAKMRAYFQTTELPGNDSYCALAQGPFGITLNGTLKDNIDAAGLSTLQG